MTGADHCGVAEGVHRVALCLLGEAPSVLQSIAANVGRVRELCSPITMSMAGCRGLFVDVTNVLVLLACQRSGLPVVVSERVDPLASTARSALGD